MSIAAIRFSPAPGTSKFRERGPVRIRMTTAISGPLAQRLEQRTHNPLVPGSNPGGPTKTATRVHQRWGAPSRHCGFDLRGESAFMAGGIYAGHNVVISFAAAHRGVRIAWFRHSGSDLHHWPPEVVLRYTL